MNSLKTKTKKRKHASRQQSGTEQRESVTIEARCAFSLAVACVFWRMRDVPSPVVISSRAQPHPTHPSCSVGYTLCKYCCSVVVCYESENMPSLSHADFLR